MKKILLFVFISLGLGAYVKAQDGQPGDEAAMKNEKIQALYVAYVTKELNLTSEEAQKFWPVHNQFENEIRAVKNDLPELEKEQARLNIKKKYQTNFNGIIGAKRCEHLFRMRSVFQRKLMERIKKHRQQQGPGRERGINRRQK